MTTTLTTHSKVVPTRVDDDFNKMSLMMRDWYRATVAPGAKLFRTNATGLFDLYLASISPTISDPVRQYFNCNCCRRFFDKYGDLVVVNDDGSITSVLWGDLAWQHIDTNNVLYKSIQALRTRVESAWIVSVFATDKPVWGTPVTDQWEHFAVNPNKENIHTDRATTPQQVMSNSIQRGRLLVDILNTYSKELLTTAHQIINTDAVTRSEQFLGPVQFLLDMHKYQPAGRTRRTTAQTNLMWKGIASAPEGFFHTKAGVIGELLEDIRDGLTYDVIVRRFNSKVGITYQRAQSAPAAGTIAQAEKLVADLGVTTSLERRFARLDEIRLTWAPKAPAKPDTREGVFAHLASKQARGAASVDVGLPRKVSTWERFVDKVLPTAQRLRFQVPMAGAFVAMTTATHADAPPIFKWDTDEDRYPVAWYLYDKGSPCRQWGLAPSTMVDVVGITQLPTPYAGTILLLAGAADTATSQGLGMFSETLKSEFFAIRSVVEAYSNAGTLTDAGGTPAAGYQVGPGSTGITIEAVIDGIATDYYIDRWE